MPSSERPDDRWWVLVTACKAGLKPVSQGTVLGSAFPDLPSSALVFGRQNIHGKQGKVLGTRANVGGFLSFPSGAMILGTPGWRRFTGLFYLPQCGRCGAILKTL